MAKLADKTTFGGRHRIETLGIVRDVLAILVFAAENEGRGADGRF
jgi:hypothetical protein